MVTNENIVKSPKISLIITHYNLGKYLSNCIESIKNQTYKNYEVIIIDDNSDNENKIFLKDFENIYKIIYLKETKGQLNAFLEGLKQATGEFVCMIDADDILLPHHLSILLKIHLDNNCAFVSSSYGEINQNGEITSLNYIDNQIKKEKNTVSENDIKDIFKIKKEYIIQKLSIKTTPFGLWAWQPSSSAMIRKEALDIIFHYPDKKYWKICADKVIFSLLHLIGGSINTDCICWLYRHHGKNNTKTTISTGNKKYLSESYTNQLIKNNLKLKFDTISMFLKNKKIFIEKFNKKNYYNMLFHLIFTSNIKLCKKALVALLHKIF